jgi:hypothetical protein
MSQTRHCAMTATMSSASSTLLRIKSFLLKYISNRNERSKIVSLSKFESELALNFFVSTSRGGSGPGSSLKVGLGLFTKKEPKPEPDGPDYWPKPDRAFINQAHRA